LKTAARDAAFPANGIVLAEALTSLAVSRNERKYSMTEQLEIIRRLERLEALVEDQEDRRLSTPETAKVYGVCTKTIQRWRADPTMGFPQPEIDAGGRAYHWLSD
jgi:predicted DNA-binding transcriptional regulator AlpA